MHERQAKDFRSGKPARNRNVLIVQPIGLQSRLVSMKLSSMIFRAQRVRTWLDTGIRFSFRAIYAQDRARKGQRVVYS
jgi:hypothetical protein